MTRERWRRALKYCSIVFVCVFVGGFGLWFQPGWANGWPGLTVHAVWSSFVAVWSMALSWSMAVACGSGLGLVCSARCLSPQRGRRLFLLLLLLATALSVAIGRLAFQGAWASTHEMWPDGYPVVEEIE